METRAPTAGHILIALGFALSCFGLLLFLWVAFGGPVPLGAKGYRVTVPFKEATQLAAESDVRISGVNVGKVKGIELGGDGEAEATLEIHPEFAPVPEGTRAILRQKTLLGETYVELTPGDREGGADLPEDGRLAEAQVSEAVQLDEILRTFDEPTRAALRSWMRDGAVAFRGRGADLSIAIAALDPFSEEANRILGILDSQRLAVRELVRSGGEVFEALSERRGQLQGLVRNTEAVFSVTAARDRELADAFVVLPTFLEESRLTLERLDGFAAETDPLVRQLRPAARELGPATRAAGELAPELERFFDGLGRATPAALDGLPALRTALDEDLPPLLGDVDPFLDQLTPILIAAKRYRHELTAFLGNTAAATNAAGPSPTGTLNYLRTTSPLGPGSLAAYPRLLDAARANPYLEPLGYEGLGSGGLESFETRHCGGGLSLALTNEGEGGFSLDPDLFERLREFAFAGETQSSIVPAPPCVQQGPVASIGGAETERTRYLHVRELP